VCVEFSFSYFFLWNAVKQSEEGKFGAPRLQIFEAFFGHKIIYAVRRELLGASYWKYE
jgi:hypothetical protein